MKRLLYIAFAVALFGCENEIKPDYAIVSGKITNKQLGDVTMNGEHKTFKETLSVSKDGSFIDTLKTDIKSYVLYDGKNPVFLKVEPGYNLNITYDALDFDNTISISGIGSEINNYLVAKRKAEISLSQKNAEIFVQTEDQFKVSMTEFKKSQEELLNSSNGLPSSFIAKEKRNLNYGYLSKLNNYERGHQYFTKNKEFKVSDGFLDEVSGVDHNNLEDFEFSSNYKEIVNDHYSSKARKISDKDTVAYDITFLKTVAVIENETIKNGLLFDFVNFNMSYSNDVDAFYNTFNKYSTNEENNNLITQKYNKLTALKTGKPSPKFSNYENYSGGKTSLDDFYKGINLVEPSFIRTDADELTYHFHIMIRYEIEKKLIEGSIEVKDLKQIWNEAYNKYLKVDVTSDKVGVLQDVHWAHGGFGYFPTYSLGSFYAAQFFNQAKKDIPSLETEIENGDNSSLLKWLRENIHQHGKFYTAKEICEKATGEALNFKYFMEYVSSKYGEIYEI